MWNRPWCVHIHATDPSLAIAMHRGVRILFVSSLTPVSAREQLGSIGPLAENCSKVQAIHSMPVHQGAAAGRGKPDGPKQLPLSLGYKYACCTRSEFGPRAGMDIHRRHSSSVGTPCADHRNSKSMSFTARGDAWWPHLRRDSSPAWYPWCVAHTCISLPIRQRAMLTSTTVNSAIMAIIVIIVITAS